MPIRGLTTNEVLKDLGKLYKPPRTFLNWDTPFHLLMATVLSAQCTDKMVNKISPGLFQKYRGPTDVLQVSTEELERDIHSCGHYHNKAKYLKAASALVLKNFKGEVPSTMQELLTLPGVGRKTAAVILYAAFGMNEGLAVDTHVMRVSRRLGLTKSKYQDRIELDLMHSAAQSQWGTLHTLLIMHGRGMCTARNRKCPECVFKHRCPSSLVLGRPDLAKEDK